MNSPQIYLSSVLPSPIASLLLPAAQPHFSIAFRANNDRPYKIVNMPA